MIHFFLKQKKITFFGSYGRITRVAQAIPSSGFWAILVPTTVDFATLGVGLLVHFSSQFIRIPIISGLVFNSALFTLIFLRFQAVFLVVGRGCQIVASRPLSTPRESIHRPLCRIPRCTSPCRRPRRPPVAARRAPPGVEVEMREFNPPPSASDASVCPPPPVLFKFIIKDILKRKCRGVRSGAGFLFKSWPTQELSPVLKGLMKGSY